MTMTSTEWSETPAFIAAADATLFGIRTRPVGSSREATVVHLRGGNQGPSSGRNRTSTTLCRRLADDGFEAFRFDYHGVGESTGRIAEFRHDKPFVDDVDACLDWLSHHGSRAFVLIGECFGARTALAERDERIQAMVLLSLPVRDAEKVRGVTKPLVRHRSLFGYARRALSPSMVRLLVSKPRRYLNAVGAALRAPSANRVKATGIEPPWVSAAVLQDLRSAVANGTRILLVAGRGDPGYEDFRAAYKGTVGEIIRDGRDLIDLQILDGRIAAWADEATQRSAIELVINWLSATIPERTGEAVRHGT